MISQKYNCIFIHIPKTAGQSIERYFLGLHGLSWSTREELLLRKNLNPGMGPERLAHLTASEYVKFGYISPQDYSSYYKFSFVRNPWARLVSEYAYRLHQSRFSFKDYVTNFLPERNPYTDAYRHIMPQYHYLHDENGERIVDYVGRFENLEADFGVVCRHLGMAHLQLPHSNKSTVGGRLSKLAALFSSRNKAKHYSEYYDAELREIVADMYKLDISTFGYSFCSGSS